MSKSGPSLDDIYDLVQPEFNHVDQKLGDRNKRLMDIADIPQNERDLYLVHDIVCITNNAGMLAWIDYHHEEKGWIRFAQEAFKRIGHSEVSEALGQCLEVFMKKHGSLTHEDDASQSRSIHNYENEIMQSLYAYLVTNDFKFPHFAV